MTCRCMSNIRHWHSSIEIGVVQMDANTPINIPIRLEQWIHDNYMEVETIIIDARPILDATGFDNLPRWED